MRNVPALEQQFRVHCSKSLRQPRSQPGLEVSIALTNNFPGQAARATPAAFFIAVYVDLVAAPSTCSADGLISPEDCPVAPRAAPAQERGATIVGESNIMSHFGGTRAPEDAPGVLIWTAVPTGMTSVRHPTRINSASWNPTRRRLHVSKIWLFDFPNSSFATCCTTAKRRNKAKPQVAAYG